MCKNHEEKKRKDNRDSPMAHPRRPRAFPLTYLIPNPNRCRPCHLPTWM